MAKGYQYPNLRMGNVEIAGRVSRRSSHLQVISLWGPEEMAAVQPGYQEHPFQADGFDRAPWGWNSRESLRVWELRAPTYGLQ